MNKFSARATALSAAAVLAFGVSAPASVAKPATGHGAAAAHGHSHATKAHTTKAHASSAHGKASAHQLRAVQKRLDKLATRLDRALTRVVRDQRLHGLDATSADTLRTNAAADQVQLEQVVADAKTAVEGGSRSDVREQFASVRAVRPEGYLIVENLLRRAADLQAQLDTQAPAASTDPAAALKAAVDEALAWSAFDGKATLREIRAELNSVEDVLAPADDTDESDPAEDTDPAETADPAETTDPATDGGTTDGSTPTA